MEAAGFPVQEQHPPIIWYDTMSFEDKVEAVDERRTPFVRT